jgi:lipoate-protein ligase A
MPDDVGYRVMELETLDPFKAMALEEVCLESVKEGGDPVIHFWEWDRTAVTIGSFQMLSDEVYQDRCLKDKVPVVRRISGGGTMFHEPGQEFIFSLTAPPGILSKDIPESYRQVLEPVRRGLEKIGIDSRIEENNLMVGEKKISGSSQRRLSKAILHHGTILYDVNPYRMLNYIKGDKVIPSGKGTCSNYRPVVCVRDLINVDMRDVYLSVKAALLEGKEYYDSKWSNEELIRADELVVSRYRNDDWNIKL